MPESNERSGKLAWAVVPVAVAAISAIGFLGGLVLYPLDYEESGVWDDLFFAMLALGWIGALISGLVAWIGGRRSRDTRLTRAGILALAWFGLVLVVESIHQAVG